MKKSFDLGIYNDWTLQAEAALAEFKPELVGAVYEPPLQGITFFAHSLPGLDELLRNEQYAAGIARCREALAKDPDNPGILNDLGAFSRLAKEYSAAEAAFRRVLARSPENVEVYRNLAVLFYETNRLALAERFSLKARELDDKDAGVWNNLGLVYFKKDAPDVIRATRMFKKAAELDPKRTEAQMNLGALALRFRDYITAEQAYSTVIDALPNAWTAHLYRAFALAGEGEGRRGEVRCDRRGVRQGSPPSCPDNAEAAFLKGESFYAAHKWQEAADAFARWKGMKNHDVSKENIADQEPFIRCFYIDRARKKEQNKEQWKESPALPPPSSIAPGQADDNTQKRKQSGTSAR